MNQRSAAMRSLKQICNTRWQAQGNCDRGAAAALLGTLKTGRQSQEFGHVAGKGKKKLRKTEILHLNHAILLAISSKSTCI